MAVLRFVERSSVNVDPFLHFSDYCWAVDFLRYDHRLPFRDGGTMEQPHCQ